MDDCRPISAGAWVLAVALVAGAAVADDGKDATGDGGTQQRIEASRAVVKSFAGSLQSELQAALKAGGAVNAIEVCRDRAPAIAREHALEQGWQVGRTSLKTRNPDNAPDAWERDVLEDFAARAAAGDNPATLEQWAVVETDDGPAFRYMKAIPTGELCVTCHGSDLAPDLAATLDRLYPADRARGYSVGDVRGAFTIIQPM